MAVIKKCDLCGKISDVSSGDRSYSYEEDGERYVINSFRLGAWNPKTRGWDSIISGYDLCHDCGQKFADFIFGINPELKTRKKMQYNKKDQAAEEE